MLHIFIVEMAVDAAVIKTANTKRKFNKRHVFVRILGDDLIAIWPKACDTAYSTLLSDSGLPISKHKHEVSTHICNFARMWFEPIFAKRERNANYGVKSWALCAGDDDLLVEQAGFADFGLRVIIGYRWIKAISVGAYGRFDSTNIFQNACMLSSYYRTDHPT